MSGTREFGTVSTHRSDDGDLTCVRFESLRDDEDGETGGLAAHYSPELFGADTVLFSATDDWPDAVPGANTISLVRHSSHFVMSVQQVQAFCKELLNAIGAGGESDD
ncbi:hypothetical protein BPY_23150 [Bifidobacterium psychraerophilum]|uniref:hypothetical protein n=1 Tax=Bifidobacterium psychraerophilum TaxID=218140 RepID=UPI00310FE302